MNERSIYRFLSAVNDVKAVRRGPRAVGRRLVRKALYRAFTRALRRSGL